MTAPATDRNPSIRAVGVLVADSYRQLTDGQRWTASLAVLLSVALLVFGLPDNAITIFEPGGAGLQTPSTPEEAATPAMTAPPDSGPLAGTPASGSTSPPTDDAPSSPPAGEEARPPAGEEASDRFVVLVRAGDGAPGRDDAAVARHFFADSGIPATFVELSGAAADCETASAAGTVAVASGGLPTALETCLVGRGTTVVTADGSGVPSPSGEDGPRAFSLVPDLRRSIVEGVTHTSATLGLDRVVGIVGMDADEEAINAAATELSSVGFEAHAVMVSGVSDVPAAVLGLNGQQPDLVVFAATVEVQRAWNTQSRLLLSQAEHLVVDAYDSLVDESYAPIFDGGYAYTVRPLGWFAREHGPTDLQNRCTDTWTAVTTPPEIVDEQERRRVYQWCSLVELLASVEPGTPLHQRLPDTTADSAYTSPIGPLGDVSWGARQAAMLQWQATCTCWTELEPFADRPTRTRQ